LAIPEHVDVAKNGALALREWTNRNRGVILDLSGADLRGLDLRTANFRLAKLRNADFNAANLESASFFRCDLVKTHLRQSATISFRTM
jgi:uncharacterized protein YjbI with pentapeptide repeats